MHSPGFPGPQVDTPNCSWSAHKLKRGSPSFRESSKTVATSKAKDFPSKNTTRVPNRGHSNLSGKKTKPKRTVSFPQLLRRLRLAIACHSRRLKVMHVHRRSWPSWRKRGPLGTLWCPFSFSDVDIAGNRCLGLSFCLGTRRPQRSIPWVWPRPSSPPLSQSLGTPWTPSSHQWPWWQRLLEKHRGPDGRATHASKTK